LTVLRRGIAGLHRRAEVSRKAAERYVDALASVDDATTLGELIQRVVQPTDWHQRRVRSPRTESEICVVGYRAGESPCGTYPPAAQRAPSPAGLGACQPRRRRSTKASMRARWSGRQIEELDPNPLPGATVTYDRCARDLGLDLGDRETKVEDGADRISIPQLEKCAAATQVADPFLGPREHAVLSEPELRPERNPRKAAGLTPLSVIA
jgi:hypothetical protein